MNTQTNDDIDFPGGVTNRTDQLAFLSLSEGSSNSFIGLQSGTKFPGEYNVFLGAGAGAFTETASSSLLAGGLCGENANRLGDTVALGYRSVQRARDCYTSVLVGSRAGEVLQRSQLNTALGYRVLGGVVSGSQNCFVGALSGITAKGIANCSCIGFSSASNITGDSHVIVGAQAGKDLIGDAVTSIGARSLANCTYASNVVVSGAYAGENSSNGMHDTVLAGFGAGRYTSNVVATLCLGSYAGEHLQNSAYNVIAGHKAAQVMTNSQFNTVIGSFSAANATATNSTVVGSKSMNRRNGDRVAFSDCVIIGERVDFDAEFKTIQLTMDDTYSMLSTGISFYDSTHLFPQPFQELVPTSGPGKGSITWIMQESILGAPLLANQRDATIFSVLKITDGTYGVWWYAKLDANGMIIQDTTSLYNCKLTITKSGATLSVLVQLYVEGSITATKQVYLTRMPSILGDPPPLWDDLTTPWMDLTIHHLPAPEVSGNPEGISLSFVFKSQGGFTSTETATIFAGGIDGDDMNGGFLVKKYATFPDETWRLSYVHIEAESLASGQRKAAYATIHHVTRVDDTFTLDYTYTRDAHTVYGAGDAANVDNVVNSNYQLVLAKPPSYLDAGATYTVGREVSKLAMACHFQIPQVAVVGMEWFSTTPTTYAHIGDGYFAECSANANVLVVSLYGNGNVLLQVDTTSILTFGTTASVSGARVPLDISVARGSDETWLQMQIVHDALSNLPIEFNVSILGYATGAYANILPPDTRASYAFTVLDPSPPIDYLTRSSVVSVVGASASGNIIAQDLIVEATKLRETPEFNNCVFVGSNFTVGGDVSNTFIVSLGKEFQILHGTPEEFTINSNKFLIGGSLTLGNAPHSNYLGFRGLTGDGYEVDIPTTYIGERVYETNTEKTELLLFKGEDPLGAFGPDRVRIVSGEFRVDMLSNVVAANANVYAYERNSFMGAGNAETVSVMVANISGVGILKNPDANHQLDINGSNARKLTGTTWLTGSDSRVKEDIRDADLKECCDIVREIPLKQFRYKEEYAPKHNDLELGWLAQDVETVMPWCVHKTVEHNLPDFRTLDSDQLVKVLWGAVRWLLLQKGI